MVARAAITTATTSRAERSRGSLGGPASRPGASIDKPIHTVDTPPPTTLVALGLPRLPKMTGTSRLFTR
jgi:hypothetical protein